MTSQPTSPLVHPIEEVTDEEQLTIEQEPDDPLMMFDGQQALVEMLERAEQEHIQ